MKAAAIQLQVADKKSKKDAIKHALDMIDTCKGADLIVLPEQWNIGFYNFDNYYTLAETDNGETVSAISAKAKELGSYIYSGTFVEKRGEKYYNTGILFDRNGTAVAKYSKIHLFGFESKEHELLTPGDKITVADTEFGRIGIATCYDLRFPELFRKMTLMYGAEFFIVSASWPAERLEAWRLYCRVRATENFCWLISSNCTGNYGNIKGGGNGMIVSPKGAVIADSGFDESIVVAEISREEVVQCRSSFCALDDVKLI